MDGAKDRDMNRKNKDRIISRRIFIVNDHRDMKDATALENTLRDRGHRVNVLVPGDIWVQTVPRQFAKTDLVVTLLTPHSVENPWIIAMAGMAIALRHRFSHRICVLIPVYMEPGITVPDPLKSFHSINLERRDKEKNPEKIVWIADQVEKAAAGHRFGPKVFISHCHEDKGFADAVVKVLKAKFNFEAEEIRCTSHPWHDLPFDVRG